MTRGEGPAPCIDVTLGSLLSTSSPAVDRLASAARFAAAGSAYDRAAAASPDAVLVRHLELAGRRVEFCCVGGDLFAALYPALAHTVVSARDGSDLSVRIWDASITGVDVPRLTDPSDPGLNGTLEVSVQSIAPETRITLDATTVLGAATAEFSTVIEWDRDWVVADRTMMWDTATGYGSHAERGIAAASTLWYLAEGATHSGFNLFYLVQNPNTTDATVEVTYLLPGGAPPVVESYTVAANSRFNIWVDLEDALLSDTAVSTTLTSLNGVTFIAERATWWPGAIATWHEAHNSAGSVGPAWCWGLAEGEQGGPGNRQTFILIANTAAVSSSVNVQLVFEGGGTSTRTFTVAPKSRFNVDVGVEFPAAAGRRFGALVGCFNVGPDLVVERAMYSNASGVVWAAGTNALATPFP